MQFCICNSAINESQNKDKFAYANMILATDDDKYLKAIVTPKTYNPCRYPLNINLYGGLIKAQMDNSSQEIRENENMPLSLINEITYENITDSSNCALQNKPFDEYIKLSVDYTQKMSEQSVIFETQENEKRTKNIEEKKNAIKEMENEKKLYQAKISQPNAIAQVTKYLNEYDLDYDDLNELESKCSDYGCNKYGIGYLAIETCFLQFKRDRMKYKNELENREDIKMDEKELEAIEDILFTSDYKKNRKDIENEKKFLKIYINSYTAYKDRSNTKYKNSNKKLHKYLKGYINCIFTDENRALINARNDELTTIMGSLPSDKNKVGSKKNLNTIYNNAIKRTTDRIDNLKKELYQLKKERQDSESTIEENKTKACISQTILENINLKTATWNESDEEDTFIKRIDI